MGLFNAILGNASEVTIEKIAKEFEPILIDGEHIEKAYKIIRDMFIFTNKRLILVEKQGVTGSKVDYQSIPYSSIKRALPKSAQFVSKTSGKLLETIGDKWTDFMITTYKTNTQPLYVITDLVGNSLNETTPTISYTPEVAIYETWLKNGITKFKK